MRYCYHCRRLTPGEPLFCNFCGRSYDTKLCPSRHPNVRAALVCSQCGSEDLSLPQPEAPWWFPLILWLVAMLPALALLILSGWLLISMGLAFLSGFAPFPETAFLALALAIAWLLYGKFVEFVRKTFGRGIRPIRKKRSRHG